MICCAKQPELQKDQTTITSLHIFKIVVLEND